MSDVGCNRVLRIFRIDTAVARVRIVFLFRDRDAHPADDPFTPAVPHMRRERRV